MAHQEAKDTMVMVVFVIFGCLGSCLLFELKAFMFGHTPGAESDNEGSGDDEILDPVTGNVILVHHHARVRHDKKWHTAHDGEVRSSCC